MNSLKVHKKRCLKSLVIREIKTETVTRYHYTPVRMANIKKRATKPSEDKDVEQLSLSYIGMGMQNDTTIFGKQFGNFLLNLHLKYNSAFPILGIFQKKMKTYKKRCMLFTIEVFKK